MKYGLRENEGTLLMGNITVPVLKCTFKESKRSSVNQGPAKTDILVSMNLANNKIIRT